tara:strand:- start:2799 stop:3308 length:510 start_codon:yes stop_codon:yes gene_type:complete
MIKKLLKNFLYTFSLFFLFFVSLVLVRQFFPGGILFYQGILVATLLVLLVFLANLIKFNNLEINNSLLSSFLLMILFNSLVPTIVDRSISVAIISIIEENQTVNEKMIEESFQKKFFEGEEINKRILEQEFSGNVQENNNEFSLTARGKLFYKLFSTVQILFKTNENLI